MRSNFRDSHAFFIQAPTDNEERTMTLQTATLLNRSVFRCNVTELLVHGSGKMWNDSGWRRLSHGKSIIGSIHLRCWLSEFRTCHDRWVCIGAESWVSESSLVMLLNIYFHNIKSYPRADFDWTAHVICLIVCTMLTWKMEIEFWPAQGNDGISSDFTTFQHRLIFATVSSIFFWIFD